VVEFEDVTGQPRPEEDIRAAIECLKSEVIYNPMGMSRSGQPLTIHYVVVLDAMRELLALRALVERAREAAKK